MSHHKYDKQFLVLCHPHHVMKSCFHVWLLPASPAQFVEHTCFGVCVDLSLGTIHLHLTREKHFVSLRALFVCFTSFEMSHYEGACGIILSGLLHSSSLRLSKSQWSEKP